MGAGVKAREATSTVTREVFQVSLVTYLLLTLAETLKSGVVSNYFNLNYLLAVVLASGLGMVLSAPPEETLVETVIRAVPQINLKPIVEAVARPFQGRYIDGPHAAKRASVRKTTDKPRSTR